MTANQSKALDETQAAEALSRKYQQLMDRALYDMRNRALGNQDAANEFMNLLTPAVEARIKGKSQKAIQELLLKLEPTFLECMLKQAIAPALGDTLRQVQSGDRLSTTQQDMHAASRAMISAAMGAGE